MEELRIVIQEHGLTVNNVQEKGRCLFTTKDFYPGDVLLRQQPYVCVPNNNASAESRCDGCFITNNLKRCSACQIVWYCGSSCQKSEWKLHRIECQSLCRLQIDKRKLITPTIRLVVKLYLRRKLQQEKVISSTAIDNYDLVEALVSHMSNIDEKQLLLYAQMANLVNLILQLPGINLKEIAEIFSKLACNAHTICDSELRPLGTGLYPVVSIINHSCLPNAVLVFEGKTAVVRAIQHIPKDYEISISYIETAGSTMTRQKALKEQYLFNCMCSRCSKVGQYDDIKESAMLEGYRCTDDQCNGFLLRDEEGFICQKCGLLRNMEEIRKTASDVKAMSYKAANASDHPEAIRVYKMIEKLEMRLYHPFSINLMRTREKLLKMLMEVEDWKEALAHCRLTIPVYQKLYPAYHPLPGLQHYTCGRLEWLLGNTEEAVKSLTAAGDIMRITHGTSTPFMKELSLQLEEARAEASYKRCLV